MGRVQPNIPFVEHIIRIMKTCRQNTSSYTLDNSPPEKEPEEKYTIKYTPKLPEIIKVSSNSSKPKDMERPGKTWMRSQTLPLTSLALSQPPRKLQPVILQ